MIPIQKVRRDTEGVNSRIHLNNAGSSLIAKPILNCMLDYLNEEAISGGYETAAKYSTQFNNIYSSVAQLLNCSLDEIALTESASVAWEKAFYSIPFEKGDKILTSHVEYGSNFISYLHLEKKKEIIIEIIPQDAYGQVDIDALIKMIDNKVKLISITHIPTNGGLVNPAEEIGKIAKKYGILYLLDACQTVGHLPIDVQKIGCDLLSATGRKYLRAPRGTGFLYVSKKINYLEPYTLSLQSATWQSEKEILIVDTAKRFEAFETSYAARLAFGKAIDYALDLGMENISNRIIYLSNYLRNKLNDITGVIVQDLGKNKCGIVTFTPAELSPVTLQNLLHKHHININFTTIGSTLIDMKNRNLTHLSRASVHYYNTEEEIDIFCDKLQEILKG
jgi:selenocysteine lyase/cysteine desulfurase